MERFLQMPTLEGWTMILFVTAVVGVLYAVQRMLMKHEDRLDEMYDHIRVLVNVVHQRREIEETDDGGVQVPAWLKAGPSFQSFNPSEPTETKEEILAKFDRFHEAIRTIATEGDEEWYRKEQLAAEPA